MEKPLLLEDAASTKLYMYIQQGGGIIIKTGFCASAEQAIVSRQMIITARRFFLYIVGTMRPALCTYEDMTVAKAVEEKTWKQLCAHQKNLCVYGLGDLMELAAPQFIVEMQKQKLYFFSAVTPKHDHIYTF